MESNKTISPADVPIVKPSDKCARGCGFFGNPVTSNMCSKCYKEHLAEQQAQSPAAAATVTSPASDAPQAPEQPAKVAQEDKTHCWKCKRSVGYTGIECRCGYVYCAKHRHAEKHSCLFDYQQQQKKQLEKANPALPDKHHFTRMDSMDSL